MSPMKAIHNFYWKKADSTKWPKSSVKIPIQEVNDEITILTKGADSRLDTLE